MFKSSNKNLNLFILFSCLLNIIILEVASLPVETTSDHSKMPAVYRRYVRRWPPIYADDEFMEEVVEEFFVQYRPPKYAMSDDDINMIIKCDSNPEYKDCYKLKAKDEPPMTNTQTTATKRPFTPPSPPPAEIPLLPELPAEEGENDEHGEEITEKPITEIDPFTAEGETESESDYPEGSGDDYNEIEANLDK